MKHVKTSAAFGVNRLISATLAALVGFILWAVPALAADLTTERASRFVETLKPVSELGQRLEAEGKNNSFSFDPMPKEGETFQPYTKAVEALAGHMPAHHAELKSIVKKQGFTPAEWGETGDRVMMAYIAAKMEKEEPGAMAQLQAMDPAMLDMMPPQVKEQMANMMAMMKTVEAVPAADKAAIEPVIPALEEFMKVEEKRTSGR